MFIYHFAYKLHYLQREFSDICFHIYCALYGLKYTMVKKDKKIEGFLFLGERTTKKNILDFGGKRHKIIFCVF
jgi:hypothetical protein